MTTVWPSAEEFAGKLRTTTIPQAKNALNDGTAMCAQGVLMHSAGYEPTSHGQGFIVDGNPVGGYAPVGPPWMSKAQLRHMARLNGVWGRSFGEIADWIEEGMPL